MSTRGWGVGSAKMQEQVAPDGQCPLAQPTPPPPIKQQSAIGLLLLEGPANCHKEEGKRAVHALRTPQGRSYMVPRPQPLTYFQQQRLSLVRHLVSREMPVNLEDFGGGGVDALRPRGRAGRTVAAC